VLRRLRPLDRVLLFTLVPLWLVCFALKIRVGDGVSFNYGVIPSESRDSYPTVVRIPTARSDMPGPVPGDRLIRFGREDLRGASFVAMLARAVNETNEELQLEVDYEHSGRRATAVIQLSSQRLWWLGIPVRGGVCVCRSDLSTACS
jgi:hypothetical protein